MKPHFSKDDRKLKLRFWSLTWFFVVSACGFQPGWGGYYNSFQWTPQNPKFQFSKEQIQDGNSYYHLSVLPYSRLAVVCPNPSTYLVRTTTPVHNHQLYESVWCVDKESFQNCKVGSPKKKGVNELWMSCDTPLALKYDWLHFMPFSAYNDLSFLPGTEHYFIGTSNGSKSSLNNKAGGHCNDQANGVSMKLSIYVCHNETDPECNLKTAAPVTSQSMHNATTLKPVLVSEAFRSSPSNNVWHLLTIVFGLGFASCLVVISLCLVVLCYRRTRKHSCDAWDKRHPLRDQNGTENKIATTDACAV